MDEQQYETIRRMLNKIATYGLDVKCGNIKTLESKIKSGILEVKDLVVNFQDLPSYIMQFINEYQTEVNSDILQKATSILNYFSSHETGAKLLNDYGAVEFFCMYKDNIKGQNALEVTVDNMLRNIVSIQSQFSKSQSQVGESIPMLYSSMTMKKESQDKENFNTQNMDFSKISVANKMLATPDDTLLANTSTFNARANDTLLEPSKQTKQLNSSQIQGPSIADTQAPANNNGTTSNRVFASQSVNLSCIKAPPVGSSYHIESDELQKLKAEKTDFMIPAVLYLNEEDEKFLFDLTVQLKFGDQKNLYRIISENLISIIRDYPLEALMIQGELLQELVPLMKRSDSEIQYLISEVFVELLTKLDETIDLHFNLKYKNKCQAKDSESFILNDEKDFIKNSYPSLKPINSSLMKDPNYIKGQKEAFRVNYYQLLDYIVQATFDITQKSEFNDNVHNVWKLTIKILRKFKYSANELVEETVKDYLRRFVKKAEDMTPSEFYENIEFSFLANDMFQLFKLFGIEEYSKMTKFNVSTVLTVMIKGIYKFLYTVQEVEAILIYTEHLCPEMHNQHVKTMNLLNSIIKFKNEETRLTGSKLESFCRNGKDLAEFANSLESIILSIPQAQYASFVNLYTDAFLYAQVCDGDESNAKETYERLKSLLVHLLNLPNQSIKTVIFESFSSALNDFAPFTFCKNKTAKRVIMFQSMLDAEFVMELVFASLGNELNINAMAKVILNFLTLCDELGIPKDKYLHIIRLFPIFYHHTQDSQPHETLKSVVGIIWKLDTSTLLRAMILDMFSKNQKRRINAFKQLRAQNFIKRVFDDEDLRYQSIKEYEMLDKQLEKNDIILDDLDESDRDPLKSFLDSDYRAFVYRPIPTTTIKDFNPNSEQHLKSVQNLLTIATDSKLEPSLRMSSYEQLAEYVVNIIQHLNGSSFNAHAVQIIIQSIQLALQDFLAYAQQNQYEPTYATRVLNILTRVNNALNVPAEVREKLYPIFDFYSEFFQKNASSLLVNLVKLANYHNETTRFQALLFLNSLAFFIDIPENKLPKDYKLAYSLKTVNFMDEHYFIINGFDHISYTTVYSELWNVYPLDEQSQYFVDQHVENYKILSDPTFSVQDYVLNGRSKIFTQRMQDFVTDITDNYILLKNAQRWTRLIQTMDLYLPKSLVNVDVFASLTKIFQNSMTFIGMRNNLMINNITEILDKIFKCPTFLKEINTTPNLVEKIIDFIDFISASVLGPLYELSFENAREKLDILISATRIITRLLSVSTKCNQPKIKHLLVKKIIRQNLFDLLGSLTSFFTNNEQLYLHTGKFVRKIFKFPEIFLVCNMDQLLSNLFDFMYKCSTVDFFRGKHLLRWFLKFFLDYSKLEEETASNVPVRNINTSINKLSDTSKKHVLNSSSLGWLLRVSEDRETHIRLSAWNLMTNLANKQILNDYQSSIETALMVIYSSNESFGVVLCAINFLNKALEMFMNVGEDELYEETETQREQQQQPLEAEFYPDDVTEPFNRTDRDEFDMDDVNLKSKTVTQRQNQIPTNGADNKKRLNRDELVRILYRRNILSHIKMLLSNENSPPLFLANLVLLLRNACVLDPQRAIPVLSQLEFWDILIEVISTKLWKKKSPGRTVFEFGAELVEIILLVSNMMQFTIFCISYERQVSDYLVYCTQMVKIIFKWLRILTACYEKPLFNSNPQNTFIIDITAMGLIQMLNSCLYINADKTIVMANKLYEDKIEKESKQSKYNLYLMISNLFNFTKNDQLMLALFKLVGNLLPQWKKGLSLVESEDRNGETLSESLILTLFQNYKLNEVLLNEQKVSWDAYYEAKSAMNSCTCALLLTSNPAKLAFICSGFLTFCMRNITKQAEFVMVEDLNSGNQTSSMKKRDPNMTMSAIMPSRFSINPMTVGQSTSYQDLRSYLVILKYFFASATVGTTREQQFYAKLQDQAPTVFEHYLRSWRCIARKEDLLDELTKGLINFASNSTISPILSSKLTDPKFPILNDIVGVITKYESIDRTVSKIAFGFLQDIVHCKEIRGYLQKGKLFDSCIQKLNNYWNLKKQWTLNNPIIMNILDLFLSLSFYSDSQTRILNESTLLEQLVDITEKCELRGPLVEKLWVLIANLSHNKSVKHIFLKYEKIFAVALTLLGIDGQSLKMKWIVTQFFVDVLHKCNGAVTLIKKEHIVDQFFYFKKEVERSLDRLTLTNTYEEENAEVIELNKKLLENLNRINLLLK